MANTAPLKALLAALALLSVSHLAAATYSDALTMSLMYFEGQRAGKLPASQRVKWRGDSALSDGRDVGADLTKGYFDAGDNVKFILPMSFTVTMLAWSVVAFSKNLGTQGELTHALDAVRWGADYLLNAHPQPNVLHAGVGDGTSDHLCWQRPEDMTTDRSTYTVNANSPGSDVAGEAAAALAAASIAFQTADPLYSSNCLNAAKSLFDFADGFRGKYSDSIPNVQEFYASTGFTDELLWAAAWLLKATGDATYSAYLVKHGVDFGGANYADNRFSWDSKRSGAQVVVADLVYSGAVKGSDLDGYKEQAGQFACAVLATQRTPGGMVYVDSWSSLQYVTSVSLALSVLTDSMGADTVTCAAGKIASADISNFVRSQVDYILGKNPNGISYMVGYGGAYPQHIHHRASNLPTVEEVADGMTCTDGWRYYNSPTANENVLTGAVVGGPKNDDSFQDVRGGFQGNEPSTYITAPLVGVLARLAA